MVRETVLTVDDLIYPLFVMEGSGQQEEVPSMPGCFRYSLDLFLDEVKAARDLGIGAIALFPLIRHDQKDNAGTESYNVAAYNVSGEYAMIKAAAERGWLDEQKCMTEALTAIARAGADVIFTYAALDFARWCR